MVDKASQDYGKLLQSVSLEKEVKSESNVIMDQYASSILAFAPNFDGLKKHIDKLEKFIEIVDSNVDDVEKSLDLAEAELRVTDYSLKGLILKPLMSKAMSGTPVVTNNTQELVIPWVSNIKDGEFQPVPIFKTAQYFESDARSADEM